MFFCSPASVFINVATAAPERLSDLFKVTQHENGFLIVMRSMRFFLVGSFVSLLQ